MKSLWAIFILVACVGCSSKTRLHTSMYLPARVDLLKLEDGSSREIKFFVKPYQQNVIFIEDNVLLRVFPYQLKSEEIYFDMECERIMPDGSLQFVTLPEARWAYFDDSMLLVIAMADSVYLQPSPSSIRRVIPDERSIQIPK